MTQDTIDTQKAANLIDKEASHSNMQGKQPTDNNSLMELLPCPFCGGKHIVLHESGNTGLLHYHCANPKCMVGTKGRYIERQAREVWNTRALKTVTAHGGGGVETWLGTDEAIKLKHKLTKEFIHKLETYKNYEHFYPEIFATVRKFFDEAMLQLHPAQGAAAKAEERGDGLIQEITNLITLDIYHQVGDDYGKKALDLVPIEIARRIAKALNQTPKDNWRPISEAPILTSILLGRADKKPTIGYVTANRGVWWEVTDSDSIPQQWKATHFMLLHTPPTPDNGSEVV